MARVHVCPCPGAKHNPTAASGTVDSQSAWSPRSTTTSVGRDERHSILCDVCVTCLDVAVLGVHVTEGQTGGAVRRHDLDARVRVVQQDTRLRR